MTDDSAKPIKQADSDRSQPIGADPVAWWVRGCEYDTGCEYEFVALLKEQAELAATNGGKAVPLYRSPTLTSEERMAVAWAVGAASNDDHPAEDILRGLLERTK